MATFFLAVIAGGEYDKITKLTEQREYLFKEIDGNCGKMKDYNQFAADQYDGKYDDKLTKHVLECKQP